MHCPLGSPFVMLEHKSEESGEYRYYILKDNEWVDFNYDADYYKMGYEMNFDMGTYPFSKNNKDKIMKIDGKSAPLNKDNIIELEHVGVQNFNSGSGDIVKTHPEEPLDKQVGGKHYKDFVIQPVEFIHKNKIGFCEGNAIKYICRHFAKNGREDLEKAKHYIDMLIQMEYSNTQKQD